MDIILFSVLMWTSGFSIAGGGRDPPPKNRTSSNFFILLFQQINFKNFAPAKHLPIFFSVVIVMYYVAPFICISSEY